MDGISYETGFQAASALVLPGWLALWASPWLGRLRRGAWLYSGALAPLTLGAAYVVLVAAHWPGAGGGYGSLAGVGALFAHPGMLLAGWLHYLAFDLLVGTWIARAGLRAGMPAWQLLPCLALTFLFGPAGLLAYLGLRHAGTIHRGVAALHARQPALTTFGLLMFAAMLPTAVAAVLDPRTLHGVGVWIKPLKFMAAIGVHVLTLAWLLGAVPEPVRRGRLLRATVAVVLATAGFEFVYITLQAGLGQDSHFNHATPLHTALYALMGLGAVLLTTASLPVAWALWRHGRALAPAWRLAAMLGSVLSAAGGVLSGALIAAHGGPLVDPTLSYSPVPLLGWSWTGGDLRPAHFVGLHALQVLPLLGVLALRLRLSRPIAWVALAAAGYTAFYAWTVGQALGGT